MENRYENRRLPRDVAGALHDKRIGGFVGVSTWQARWSAPGADLGYQHHDDHRRACTSGRGHRDRRFRRECWGSDDQYIIIDHNYVNYGHYLVSKLSRTFGEGPFPPIRPGRDLGLTGVSPILAGGNFQL